MKKLIPLILLMMMSLQGFSQSVIDTTKIQLKKTIARLVIKDLIIGDGAQKEIKLLSNKLNLLESKVFIKDSVIFSLNERVTNFESMLNTQSDQIALSRELSAKLQLDLKKQKVKTKLMSGAGIVSYSWYFSTSKINMADLKKVIRQEYLKCAKDPVHFMRKYCYIQHPQRGRIQFNLYPFQEKVLTLMRDNPYSIILKSRQLGISTLSAGYSLWLMTFHKDKNILMYCNKAGNG